MNYKVGDIVKFGHKTKSIILIFITSEEDDWSFGEIIEVYDRSCEIKFLHGPFRGRTIIQDKKKIYRLANNEELQKLVC